MVDKYTTHRGDTRNEISCQYSQLMSTNSNSNQQHYPSFSSTLLDAIYRSIDEDEEPPMAVIDHKAEPLRKKKWQQDGCNILRGSSSDKEEEIANFRRSCMIKKWIDQKTLTGNVQRSKHQSSSVNMKTLYRRTTSYNSYSSSSSSSDSGFFSESFPLQEPKPVLTGVGLDENCRRHNENGHTHTRGDQSEAKPTTKAKMDAGDYKKKKKKPISPGAKLGSLFSSLLLMRSKPNNNKISIDLISPNCSHDSSKSTTTSTCSSASSFSRSSLSKTPSSSLGKPKRSVRFSVADDNDNNNKSYHITSTKTNIREQELLMVKNHRQVEEVRSYPKKNQNQIELRFDQHEFEEEDDDDGAASYSSSDLFELDINLSAIELMGDQQMRHIAAHELPVFETTNLQTNRAIANSFIL